MQLYSLVRRHFALSLVLALVGNFIVIRLMSQNADALKSSDSPRGILSLELVKSDTDQKSILQTWANTPVTGTNMAALQVAQRQTKFDFFFILFYTALLCLLLVRLAPAHKRETWIKVKVSLGILTGLLDCIENVSMLRAMNLRSVPSWQIWFPSAAKWLLALGLSSVVLLRCVFLIYAGLHNMRKEQKSIKPIT